MKTSLLDNILETVLHGTGDSDKHLLTIFSIAISIGAKNILELGVRNGATTLPLLAAADYNGGRLESVDIQPLNVPRSLKIFGISIKNILWIF